MDMSNEVELRIYSNKGLHQHLYEEAWLTLPASRGEIIDALDRAQVPYGSGEYTVKPTSGTPDIVCDVLRNSPRTPTLTELNALAERLAEMDDTQIDALAAIAEHRDTSYDITDVINATYNLEHYDIYPGIDSYEELGNHAVDNLELEWMKTLPDEALKCLDLEKVGELYEKQEGGSMTWKGYVQPSSDEWTCVYGGYSMIVPSVRYQPEEPMLKLQLQAKKPSQAEGETVWLDLPLSDYKVAPVLQQLGVIGLDECRVVSVSDGYIPQLNEDILSDVDINQINELTEALRAIPREKCATFKAALELEQPRSLSEYIEIADRIEQYDLRHFSPSELNIMMKRTNLGAELMEDVGMAMRAINLESQGYHFTNYGYITRDADLHQEQETGQTMI